MNSLTSMEKTDLCVAMARAMEPEAWMRMDAGPDDDKPSKEDGVKAMASIRHASAVMQLLRQEGLI